jgi:hypothetical protein
MSLRVEVSFFVARPEIEDRYEVGVATGRSTKAPSKKIGHELIYFLLLQLQ